MQVEGEAGGKESREARARPRCARKEGRRERGGEGKEMQEHEKNRRLTTESWLGFCSCGVRKEERFEG